MTASRRSLRLSLFDAFFFSLMVGAGETYLPAYALSVGMGEALSGLFATVPMVAGALVQLYTPFLVQKVGSIKRFVVGATLLQALAFLPLIYFTVFGVPNFLVLFLISGFYWGAGFAAGPAWNFWMGHLVPEKETAAYLSLRMRVSQLGILVGLVGGGYALHLNIALGSFTSVFSGLFVVAFLSRASSSLILSAKTYDPSWFFGLKSLSIHETFKRFTSNKSFLQFFFIFIYFQFGNFYFSAVCNSIFLGATSYEL